MNEMLERVTRAVKAANSDEDKARAAIRAMRTPTEAMHRAGDASCTGYYNVGAHRAWPAMIDEALK